MDQDRDALEAIQEASAVARGDQRERAARDLARIVAAYHKELLSLGMDEDVAAELAAYLQGDLLFDGFLR